MRDTKKNSAQLDQLQMVCQSIREIWAESWNVETSVLDSNATEATCEMDILLFQLMARGLYSNLTPSEHVQCPS